MEDYSLCATLGTVETADVAAGRPATRDGKSWLGGADCCRDGKSWLGGADCCMEIVTSRGYPPGMTRRKKWILWSSVILIPLLGVLGFVCIAFFKVFHAHEHCIKNTGMAFRQATKHPKQPNYKGTVNVHLTGDCGSCGAGVALDSDFAVHIWRNQTKATKKETLNFNLHPRERRRGAFRLFQHLREWKHRG